MGALECPAVGSSVFNSPFVELITCRKTRQQRRTQTRASEQRLQGGDRFDPDVFIQNSAAFTSESLYEECDSAH